jgi:hypothetical protein
MNWFKKAQIWKNNSDGKFLDEIESIYEFEYKLHALNNFKFKGTPQRRLNIINKLEESLYNSINTIKGYLLPVFEKWLSNHALLDPQVWANQRMSDETDIDQALTNMLFEYNRYASIPSIKGSPRKNAKDQILSFISDNEAQFPSLNFVIDAIRDDYLQSMVTDIVDGYNNYSIEVNNSMTQDQIEEAVFAKFGDVDLMQMIESFDQLVQSIEFVGADWRQFFTEIYANIIFPLWFDYWSAMGIEETRNEIEDIYQMLQKNDLASLKETIARAINAAHQTGNMLEDYSDLPAEDAEQILNDLTNGDKYIPIWNKELREIGVVVPPSAKREYVKTYARSYSNWFKRQFKKKVIS